MSTRQLNRGANALAIAAFALVLVLVVSATFLASPGFQSGGATPAPPPSSWTRLLPLGVPPMPRGFHGAAGGYDPVSNRLIIFGGTYREDGVYYTLGDVWVLTNANGQSGPSQWIYPVNTSGSSPSRGGHTAVYDPGSNRLIVFGGCINFCQTRLNDVWVLTNANGIGGSSVWQQLSPAGIGPTARIHASAVYDAVSNRMILFGGQDGTGGNCATFGETWVLSNANGVGDPPVWSRLATAGGPPAGQYGPSGAYIAGTNQLVVFGGWGLVGGTCQFTNATWRLSHANGDGGTPTWTNLVPEGAAGAVTARAYEEAAAYDPISDRLISHQNDAWRLSHVSGAGGSPRWTHMLPNGPGPTLDVDGVSAYDSANDVLMMFSGTYGNEVWLLNGAARGNSNAAGPAISAVAASAITGHEATVTWTTDQESDSIVEYGTTTDYGNSASLGDMVTIHSLRLIGLAPDTLYHYRVTSTNDDGHASTSADVTFKTAAAPAITAGPFVGEVTGTTARITWTTDQSSNSVVHYSSGAPDDTHVVTIDSFETSHDVVLTSLSPATTYHFDVSSTNDVSLTATSDDHTFTTVSAPPAITNVTATNVTGTAATINWATDQPADSLVEYGVLTGNGVPPIFDHSTGPDAALVTSHSRILTGLMPDTMYVYRVRSAGGNGASTTSAPFPFKTQPPPHISSVTATDVTATTAIASWATDLPASSLVEYGFLLSNGGPPTFDHSTGPDAALVNTHSKALTGLTPDTMYVYRVTSVGGDGASTTSAPFPLKTQPPPHISSVTATDVTATTAIISWATDRPTSSLVEYGFLPSSGGPPTFDHSTGPDTALVTSHSKTLTGLTPNTTYVYRVTSTGGDGATTTSSEFHFTTARPPSILNVAVTNLMGTTATIGWSTDQPADSLVEYGTTPAYDHATAPDATLVFTHTKILAGLTPDTIYFYRVTSTGSDGATASVTGMFTTLAPPVISLVTATDVTDTTARVTWTTDRAAGSIVDYGIAATSEHSTGPDGLFVINHSRTLTGLTPDTTYVYRVTSASNDGTTTTTADFTFRTAAPPSTPVITALTVSDITSTTARVTWTTDQLSNSTVNCDGRVLTDSALLTQHGVTVTSLTPGLVYICHVSSANAATPPATATATSADFRTLGPVAIIFVTPFRTGTDVDIHWVTDVPADSQVEYGTTTAYGDSTILAEPTANHDVFLINLTPDTLYHFRVKSARPDRPTGVSGDFTFRTDPPPPTISNVMASNLTPAAISGTVATISWVTDHAADSQVEYGFTSTYGRTTPVDSTLTTAHVVNVSGLVAGSTYHYRVRSTDNTGQTSTSGDFIFVNSFTLDLMTLGPTSVAGGLETAAGTIAVKGPAVGTNPQRVVTMSSDNPAIVSFSPTPVRVPFGGSQASFTVNTAPVQTEIMVTITATFNGTSVSAPLQVKPRPTVTSVVMDQPSVVGGQDATGTVNFSGPAVGTNAQRTVTLTSSNPAVAGFPPAAVRPDPGMTSVRFTVRTAVVPAETTVAITASAYGTSQSASLTVRPLPIVTRVNVAPFPGAAILVGGAEDSIGTVFLNEPAIGTPAQREVTLTSSNPDIANVPASVTLKPGETTKTFTITTHFVPVIGVASISASLNGSTVTSGSGSVVVIKLPDVATVAFAPSTVIGGLADTIATVTLSYQATGTAAQRRVSLSSDNAAANVPATVVVPAGETSMTFPVKSKAVSAPTTVNIAATINGYPARTAALTVNPVRVADLSVSPGFVRGGAGNATVTVTLNAPAVGTTAQRTMTFSSSHPAAASVPAQVVVPAGVTTFTFQATSHAVALNTTVTISATLNGATAATTLVVQR